MFVFLAAVFAIGFVAFGVGSDVQGGVADIIGIGGSAGQPSVEDAREKARENPRDPQALRELATALQTAGRPEEAIAPLERYTRLRPNDEDSLRELAGSYLTRANKLREEYALAAYEGQTLVPGIDFRPPATTAVGRALGTPPITQAVSARVSERTNRIASQLTSAYGDAKTAYTRIARIAPEDASVQIQLADAAQNAGDYPTAIVAYRKFLALAPDDPSAPLVRQEIERLEATTGAGGNPGVSPTPAG